MRKYKLIGYIILSTSLFSCFSEYVFTNSGELQERKTTIKGYTMRKHQSYTSDNRLVRGFVLNTLSDTLENRCFTFSNVQEIKEVLGKQNVVSKYNYVLRKTDFSLNNDCIGLYYLFKDYDNKQKNGIRIPVLRFDDKITMNVCFRDGGYLSGDSTRINSELDEFKMRYKDKYSEKTFKELTRYYKNGINLSIDKFLR